jgi:hypothetical protein
VAWICAVDVIKRQEFFLALAATLAVHISDSAKPCLQRVQIREPVVAGFATIDAPPPESPFVL